MSEPVVERSEGQKEYREIQLGPKTVQIPSDWGVASLGNEEYATRTMGGTPDTGIEKYWDGEIPWMRSGDLHKKWISDVEGRITEEGKEASRAELIPKHSVLVGLNGQGKTKGTVAVNEIEITANQSVGAYLLNHDKLDYRYVFYSLESQYEIFRALAGGGRSGLNLKLLGQMKVPLPPLSEQRRIADVLSTVDERIQEADNAIEETEELKRALMQNFFEPELSPLKNNLRKTEDWETGQIREFGAEFVAGGTPSRSEEQYFGGDIPWLKTGAVQNSRVEESEEFLTQSGLENSTAKIVPPGSVLVAMYGGGTVGNVGLLEFEATTNQACCAILTKDSDLNNEFLYYQLLYEHRRLVSYAAGASQQNLSKHDVEQFDITVPPMNEQEWIADILSTVEKWTKQERQTKQKLQELKRGLMQDLLTGKRRLKTE